MLTSFATPDKQAFPRHSLSRAALITSGSPIFFLDAFTTLIVFYSSTADPTLPFPPPQDCKLFHCSDASFKPSSLFPTLVYLSYPACFLSPFIFRLIKKHYKQAQARAKYYSKTHVYQRRAGRCHSVRELSYRRTRRGRQWLH